MTKTTRIFGVTTLLAFCAAAFPARAMLVLQGPEDFQGTGLGTVNTILTLQSPANSSFEAGSVAFGDVTSGDAKTGSSQTQTRTIGELGVTSASNIRLVFNALEPGNGANNIALDDLKLTIFSANGAELWSSGVFTPVSFADTFTGAGNSGFVFALDAAQAAEAQAAAFGAGFASNVIGLSAGLSNATGGFETFFVANAGVTAAVPEPQTYALMLAGLAAVGFMTTRRRRPSK